jgi:hypothetical protein
VVGQERPLAAGLTDIPAPDQPTTRHQVGSLLGMSAARHLNGTDTSDLKYSTDYTTCKVVVKVVDLL